MIINPRASSNDHLIRVVLLLAACVFWIYPASGQDKAALPEGEGRDLLAERCVTCHAIGTAVAKRASRDVWAETVERMISVHGAPISNADRVTIVDYLAEHFGESAIADAGQQMVAEQCYRCHGDGMWRDLDTDRAGWVSAIYRMVGRGGVWTEDQINLMADYLAETFPQEGDR